MNNRPNTTPLSNPDTSQRRRAAWTAGLGLLFMGLMAPFAFFGVLQNLVVPADASATVNNIVASPGLFRSGVAVFLIVIVLDIVVAWALYVLLAPVNRTLSMVIAWLRVVYATVFASALANLLDVAQLLDGSGGARLQSEQLEAQVMASLTRFDSGYEGIGLAIFGLHLIGLGYLVFNSVHFPRFLGALVVVAGAGYLFDSFGTVLVPGYAWTIAAYTFVGEVLLMGWLLWRAFKGFPADGSADQRWVHGSTAPVSRHTEARREDYQGSQASGFRIRSARSRK